MQIKKRPIIRHKRPAPADSAKFNIFNCIDKLFDIFSGGVRLIGPAFALSVMVFIMIITHAYFQVVLPYWMTKFNIITCLLLTGLGLFFLLSIIFNYSLAVIVKPCILEDIINSKYYKKANPLNSSNSIIDFTYVISNPINKLNKEAEDKEIDKDTNTINNTRNNNSMMTLDNSNCIPIVRIVNKEETDQFQPIVNDKRYPECKYCKQFKALRSHHCSVCNLCVFKMDHHCPWINNCIGQNNQRYFLLFLIHVQFGTLFFMLMSIPIWLYTAYTKSTEYLFVSVLCIFCFLIATFFSTWQLKLVMKGRTSIEHWSLKNKIDLIYKINDFSLGNWRENMYMVFGTRSLLRALFVPSIKKLPYAGLEWTKIAYPDFELADICETKGNV